MLRLFSCLLFAALAIWGQEFEVVSVKPSKAENGNSGNNTNRTKWVAENVRLARLITRAYGLKEYQLQGPEWLNSERFDIVAKFPESLPKDKDERLAVTRVMMQKMLVDRFKLQLHHEQKVFSVYGLTVGKSGIKFKQVPDTDSHNQNSNNTHFKGDCIPMDGLADFLSGQFDRPVVDMTELKGFFDVILDWVPEPRASQGSKGEAPVASDSLAGPTLMTAIQDQLGLKLEGRKASINIVVIDHAERVPIAN